MKTKENELKAALDMWYNMDEKQVLEQLRYIINKEVQEAKAEFLEMIDAEQKENGYSLILEHLKRMLRAEENEIPCPMGAIELPENELNDDYLKGWADGKREAKKQFLDTIEDVYTEWERSNKHINWRKQLRAEVEK